MQRLVGRRHRDEPALADRREHAEEHGLDARERQPGVDGLTGRGAEGHGALLASLADVRTDPRGRHVACGERIRWDATEDRWDDEPDEGDVEEEVLERGYAPWEVRVEAETLGDAHDLAEQLRSEGYDVSRTFTFVIAASVALTGPASPLRVQPGLCVRIMTGAPMPEGDTLYPIAFKGTLGQYTEESAEDLTCKFGEGFTGQVAESGNRLRQDSTDAEASNRLHEG